MSCQTLVDQEILKIVDPMIDLVIQGANNRDYRLHSGNFSLSLKDKLTADAFLEQCDQRNSSFGRLGERSLVAIFRKEKFFTVIWAMASTGTSEDVMMLATIALKGGRYFIDDLLIH